MCLLGYVTDQTAKSEILKLVRNTRANRDEPIAFLFVFTVPRLCNADFSTPGTCYTLVDEPMEYWDADKYCNNTYPGPGDFAVLGDQQTQDFLASEVQKKGWPKTWISGGVADRRWKWLESKFFGVDGFIS